MAHIPGLSVFKLESFTFDRQWTHMAFAHRLSLEILLNICTSSLYGG